MRIYDAATAAYLSAREGVIARTLVWITARNRISGSAETAGFWNGLDDLTITVDGQPRLYRGAGALMSVEGISAGVGLEVRVVQVTLSPLAPEVAQVLRGYDPRLAPVEIHRALFDLGTGALVGAPHRTFRGAVSDLSIVTGEDAQATLSLVSAARDLTRSVSAYRSDASMRQRAATDSFRAYADISGEVDVWWGEKRRTSEAASAAKPPSSKTDFYGDT